MSCSHSNGSVIGGIFRSLRLAAITIIFAALACLSPAQAKEKAFLFTPVPKTAETATAEPTLEPLADFAAQGSALSPDSQSVPAEEPGASPASPTSAGDPATMAPSVSPSPTPNPALNPPEGGDPATRPFALKPSGPKSTAAPTKDADPLNLLSELTSKFFDEIATELLPLSPEEIKAFRAKIDTRAKALSDSPPGSLASRAVAFRVAPGLDPPKVTLTPGLVTALVFTTPSGQPWPVTSNALGSGSLFNAEILTGAEHQILVSPLAHHGHSNLVVGLKGLDQPLMIRLEIASGVDPNRQVDGLVNFQIRNANRPTSNEAGVSLTPGLSTAYDLLEGRDPGDGSFLPTEPALGDSLIFQKTGGGPIYVRTPLLVRWPIWSERATSPGGYSVYEISPVSEIVVQSDGGLFRVNLARVRHGDGQQP